MPKKIKKNDTLNRIIDCAEPLFAKQGYNGTSTRQIASEAGISIQTLHYHCGGKSKLYNTVLERSVVPVTNMINRHIQKMLNKDLNDDVILQESIGMLIDELFDALNDNPNYAPLFYRQWLEQDRDLKRVEWENLVPFFRGWAEQVEENVDEERRSGIDLPLVFLSLSWMYWGLFVQPEFISGLLGLSPSSPEYMERLKTHAKEMTTRMLGREKATENGNKG